LTNVLYALLMSTMHTACHANLIHLDHPSIFYGAQQFITVFTRAYHRPLAWARYIQSVHFHPLSSTSILMLTSYLCLGLQ
jgi:hypothetical protein